MLQVRLRYVPNVDIMITQSDRNWLVADKASTATRMSSHISKCLVREKGAPLEIVSAPEPRTIGPTEVTIRLQAIAINPADFKMIDQGHRVTSWPFVPGLDGAGIVEATGNKVTTFAPGDRVIALFVPGDRGGSYQTLASVQEKDVTKIPSSWSFEDASTLGYVTCVLTPSLVHTILVTNTCAPESAT